MINLFKIKKKQRDQGPSAGELRLLKDLCELNNDYESLTIFFPNTDDVMNFDILITPDEGFYKGGEFLFSFKVSPIYPHDPPKVMCKTKIIHPNIDLEGKVCLNVLGGDWKPVININTIVAGLFHLFINPNFDDPLNRHAEALLKQREAYAYVGPRLWQP